MLGIVVVGTVEAAVDGPAVVDAIDIRQSIAASIAFRRLPHCDAKTEQMTHSGLSQSQ